MIRLLLLALLGFLISLVILSCFFLNDDDLIHFCSEIDCIFVLIVSIVFILIILELAVL